MNRTMDGGDLEDRMVIGSDGSVVKVEVDFRVTEAMVGPMHMFEVCVV